MTFVTRAGCHLCEIAEGVLARVAARYRVAVATVDMDTDDDLVRLYSLRIPVLLGPSGEVVAEGIFDETDLRRAFRDLRRSR